MSKINTRAAKESRLKDLEKDINAVTLSELKVDISSFKVEDADTVKVSINELIYCYKQTNMHFRN